MLFRIFQTRQFIYIRLDSKSIPSSNLKSRLVSLNMWEDSGRSIQSVERLHKTFSQLFYN